MTTQSIFTQAAVSRPIWETACMPLRCYHIWLHLGAHNNPALIALEPSVYFSLRRYAEVLGEDA